MSSVRWRRLQASFGILVASALVLTACSGSKEPESKPKPPAPTATPVKCGDFRIAYDPTNGYEASAFIVGAIAENELDCKVTYVKTTTRQAWRLVARGGADVYMDAYGSPEISAELGAEDGPITLLGPNGIRGGVDMLAPAFMGDKGLVNAQDLNNTDEIGWGSTTPAITTVPPLLALANAFVDFQNLDYAVRDLEQIRGRQGEGMGYLIQQPRVDDARGQPNIYLAEGPRAMLGDGPGRVFVDIPESAAKPCEPDRFTTTCSLGDFSYEKIANSDFAASGSPAYSLVYNYRLAREDIATIIELIELSGYQVGPADVASWVNTHEDVWKRWLE